MSDTPSAPEALRSLASEFYEKADHALDARRGEVDGVAAYLRGKSDERLSERQAVYQDAADRLKTLADSLEADDE